MVKIPLLFKVNCNTLEVTLKDPYLEAKRISIRALFIDQVVKAPSSVLISHVALNKPLRSPRVSFVCV